MAPSRLSSFAPATAVVAVAAAAASSIIILFYRSASEERRRRKVYETRIAKLEETRQSERTGRIRAEMKLRTCLKNQQLSMSVIPEEDGTNDRVTTDAQNQHNLQLDCIGTIVSPYTKRMGTPRQGALVPSGRGYIQLRIPVECVEGLDDYSHAWVVFTFHANTDTPKSVTSKQSNSKKQKQKLQGGASTFLNLSKTKIRPPRAPNGVKVGMLATRSPHRPNNIGLSLVQIVSVDKKNKRLHISALDLVNGTPVYDIKPCVPWDVPGHYEHNPSLLSVPTWVSQDDELKSVTFTSLAQESLERCVRNGKLGPLYTLENDGLEGATQTIQQILAQDPRASNSNGHNKRGSSSSSPNNNSTNSKKDDIYKMLLCSVEIEFRVGGAGDDESNGGVTVVNVNDDLDLKNVEHVDGIPILLK